jgi:hypothetical protein
MREMREKAAAFEKKKKARAEASSAASDPVSAEATAGAGASKRTSRTPKEIVYAYLYDRGDEVLNAAFAQFPAQTEAIVGKLSELILAGEIQSRISGGELLSLFRSVGLRVRIDTSIKVEKEGKLVSLSEKLRKDEQ